jgi:hypothetical protein
VISNSISYVNNYARSKNAYMENPQYRLVNARGAWVYSYYSGELVDSSLSRKVDQRLFKTDSGTIAITVTLVNTGR